jgi:hypothetical protein
MDVNFDIYNTISGQFQIGNFWLIIILIAGFVTFVDLAKERFGNWMKYEELFDYYK